MENDDAEKMDWQTLHLWCQSQDIEHRFWSPEEVHRAQRLFIRKQGRVPSNEAIKAHFGNRLQGMIQAILRDRKEELRIESLLNSDNKPCAVCGNETNLTRHRFGMAKMLGKKRSWTGTVASVGLTAVTLPLLGAGMLRGPSTTKKANIMKLHLPLCNDCVESRRNFLGGFHVKVAEAQLHQAWKELFEAGFTDFISDIDLRQKWGISPTIKK